MAAKKITYTATAIIDGVEYTSTRTSARPYTHAGFRKSTKSGYFASFHSSAELAGRKSEYGECFAVVEVTVQGAEPKAEAPKAPAKRTRKAAAPKVDPALMEIVTFVLGGAHTAKTVQNKAFLTEAAVLLKNNEVEAARKTLVPLRTRVALKAIKMIHAL